MIFIKFFSYLRKEKSIIGVSVGLSSKQGPTVKTRPFVVNKKGKAKAFPFYKNSLFYVI